VSLKREKSLKSEKSLKQEKSMTGQASQKKKRRPSCVFLPSRHNGGVVSDAIVTAEGSSQIQSLVDEIFEDSEVFDPEHGAISGLPRFDRQELESGALLGQGEFGLVHEVCRVKLTRLTKQNSIPSTAGSTHVDGNSATALTADGEESDDVEPPFNKPKIQNREFISRNLYREGKNARYAIKVVNTTPPQPSSPHEEGVDQTTHTLQAIVDLSNEAHFLSEFNHGNIIKIRAMSSKICDSTSFIVLDRIYDTLSDRIRLWKSKETKVKKILSKVRLNSKSKKEEFLLVRMVVIHDLCEAMAFLHERKILHRDLVRLSNQLVLCFGTLSLLPIIAYFFLIDVCCQFTVTETRKYWF
jgi:serine/threonine protein kinase